MNEEATFLETLRRGPEDDTARLVYADWLDERGDHGKAAYLRQLVAMICGEPGQDMPWNWRVLQLRRMRTSLPAEWVAAVHSPRYDRALALAEWTREDLILCDPHGERVQAQLRRMARLAKLPVGEPLVLAEAEFSQPFGLRIGPKPNRKARRARRKQ